MNIFPYQIQRLIEASRERRTRVKPRTASKQSQTQASFAQWAQAPIKTANISQHICRTPNPTFRDCANALLLVMFGLLHTADGIITYLGLKFTEVDEANPVLVFFADQFGLGYSITVMKLMCLAVIAYLFFGRRKIKSRLSTATLTGAVTFYCWVVTNNVFLVVNA